MPSTDDRRTFLKGLCAVALAGSGALMPDDAMTQGLPDGQQPADFARQRFLTHWNCAQAVVEACSPRIRHPLATAVAAATPLAGGMCQGATCGALTGGYLVIGLVHGAEGAPKDAVASRMAALREDFRARFGVLECSALLGTDMATEAGVKQAGAQGLFTSKCPLLVQAVAAKLHEVL